MVRLLLVAVAIGTAAGPGAAQTVSPLIAEHDAPTTARFEIRNTGLYPITVVVEPRTFQLDSQGVPTFGPLPEHVRVRLSETSFQVPPLGRHTVYYQVDADRLPAWFTLYSTVTGPRPESGVQLRIQLPHTVYVYGDALAAEDVEVEGARWDAAAGAVVVDLRNRSVRLGRVQVARVDGAGSDAEHPGFPLLPGSRRTIRIPWPETGAPTRLTLDFGAFQLRHGVTRADGSGAPPPSS